MDTKKTIARNALWNWAGLATSMLVGFYILPFLVRHLGDTTYGLWILIASLTSYFGVFDLGIGGSVGRNIAFHRARNDVTGVNAILSTALVYLCGAAVLALLATLGACFLFFLVVDVPPDQIDSVRVAILLIGLGLAMALPLQSFDGILMAYQRFDLQNGVDIPTVIVRAGLTYWFVSAGHGLVALALITLATSLACLAIKVVLALRLEPGLRIRFSFINREAARGLFGYGVWYFLFSLIKTIGPKITLLIVGSRLLGAALATPFSLAMQLIGYANQFLIAGTGVLTPVATAFHAREDDSRQRSLLLAGGRGCLALTLLFYSLFAFLGLRLIRLWVPSQEAAYPLLLILAAGEILPMSQHITFSIILGRGKLRILAANSLMELVVGTSMALLLAANGFGLAAVCVAVAIPAALGRGVSPLVYACRSVGVPMKTYVLGAFVPCILVVAGPILLLGVVSQWWTPNTWLELFLCGGVYALIYLGVAGVGLFGIEVWRDLARRIIGTKEKQAELMDLTKE